MQINVSVEDIESIDLTTPIETRTRHDEEGDPEEYEVTLGHLIADKVTAALKKDDSWGGIKKRFLEIRDEEIREAVKPIVKDAIERPIVKTNTYGEPTGTTTTLTEVIVAEANKLLSERDGYGGHRGATFTQKIANEAVGRAFESELAKVLADEKAKVVAAVRAKAADLIADAVKQGVGR